MRAVGVIAQAEVFIDLQQALLMGDRSGETPAARIIAKKSGRAGFEPAIGQACRSILA